MRCFESVFVLACAGGVVLAGPTTESMKVIPQDLAANDEFGTSISASNGIALIGSRLDDEPGLNNGSAYLFTISTGAQIMKLSAPDNPSGSSFGVSVSLDMDADPPLALVGMDRDRENGIDSGSAYLFNAQTGAFITKFLDGDGQGGDLYGNSVCVYGGHVLIGALSNDANGSGAGLAFLYDASTSSFLGVLEPEVPGANTLFGCSVALSDTVALIGARREQSNGNSSGAAYLFDLSTGGQLSNFAPPDNNTGDQFGYSVAVSGNIAAISAIATGDLGAASGSVYVYNISNPSVPVMVQKLLAPDGDGGDELGRDVDIEATDSGYRVVSGAWRAEPYGDDSGAAYVFDLDSMGQLVSSTVLHPSDPSINMNFGTSVAVDDSGTVLVGAPDDDADFSNGGSAYIFESLSAPCPADLNGDGALNFFDVSAFLTAYQAQSPAADFNNDGVYNFFDVSAFLTAFSAGCP